MGQCESGFVAREVWAFQNWYHTDCLVATLNY